MAEDQEKTEEPTPRRREEARKKGQVARSMDLNGAALLMAGMVLLYFFGPGMRDSFMEMMRWCFTQMYHVDFSVQAINELFVVFTKKMLMLVAPFTIGLMFFALLVSFAQSGLALSWEAMVPNLNKLNPISGMKKIFSMQAVMRVLMSLLKLMVIGVVTYWAVIKDIDLLFGLSAYELPEIFAITCQVGFWMVVKMALAMLALAMLDYIYQRHTHEQQLKMSRQEIKEEMKQYEGDPQIKGKRRQKMMQMAYQRMMQAVPQADVVVTNPTRLAVALEYDPSEADAPVVVAKGQRLVAERIKEIARQHGIPIVEDKPLARALFKTVEVGEEVPPALYRAVAKVIGYIYRLKKKKAPAV